jgi:putative transposase
MSQSYKHTNTVVFLINYHFVWCPKRRRKVLTGPVEKDLRKLLSAKAADLDCEILVMEIMPDHVHLFLECDPTFSVSEITNRLKGYTSRILRQEFRLLRSRLPTLWSRSYYAGSVGNVSEATVRKYIESQKGK